MKAFVSACVSICSLMAAAWTTDESFYVAATNALACHEVVVSSGFTNQLSQFIAHPTSSEALFCAKILEIVVRQEQYEDEADEVNLRESVSAASNIVASTANRVDWQFGAARLVYVGCLCENSDDQLAFSVATNSLPAVQNLSAQSNMFLRALIDYHEMPELNLVQALKAFAALIAVKHNMTRQGNSFAADLPVKYQGMVREVRDAVSPAEEGE